MIDLKDLRQNPDRYRQAAVNKRIDVDIDQALALDQSVRELSQQQQALTTEKNQIGKQIGQLAGKLKKAGDDEKADIQQQMASLQRRPNEIKQEEQQITEQLRELEPQLHAVVLRVPQPPADDVPVGKDDTQNVELRQWGKVREFDFEPKDHMTLGQDLGMIDVERGVKLAGSRSYFLTGAGAMLHQAVLRMAFDMMVYEKGYEAQAVPVLVREPAMVGTGYFPIGRDQSYEMSGEDPPIYLVGTAEVSLTAYAMDEVIDGAALPRKTVAMSPCFRREAGTYGKDTAGLYRIHQFDKVEQVVVCENDEQTSKQFHEEILANAEQMLQRLDLPYRVVYVCSGDLGQGQVAKYDIETWMPSRNAYCETHSASRFYDFQARRLNMRYKAADGKTRFCHTLNNTVIASPRILIPIMELYQNADGSITVPDALQPYLNGLKTITP